MPPHRWSRSVFRIGLIAILAIAFCAWHWRGELSRWPAKPARAIASSAFVNQPDQNWDSRTRRAFDAALPDELMLGPTFGEAIDKLGIAGRASFYVNWRAIEPVAKRETPISLSVGGDKLVDAIIKFLHSADPARDRLGFEVRNSGDRIEIGISTRDDLMMNVTTRVYDARDLIISKSGTTRTGWKSNDPVRDESVDQLIKRLQKSVAPETWKAHGGKMGATNEMAGQLIVTQTPENHGLIVYELEFMRWRRQTLAWTMKSMWVVLPALLVAFGIEYLVLLRRGCVARRIGLCRNCGYDLRASTERCPECGRAIDAADRPTIADPVITS